MGVIDRLATSLSRRDETPNLELAQSVVDHADKVAVRELVDNLTNRNKNVQSDCIKVLYEIGGRKPALISNYVREFLALLESKNNRLVWGAMTALDTITLEDPETIYSGLPAIVGATNSGSVIARDHAVSILTKMVTIRKFEKTAFKLLIEQLKTCPTNQLPMYAENAMRIVNNDNRKMLVNTLSSRMRSIEKLSKRKRVEHVIEKLGQPG
jgi:hypothetical protein